MKILDKINSPDDIKALSFRELGMLCTEIRQFLVENVSKTGGHLASNLGSVELEVAIHNVFDTRRDRLVFDVGHQSYIHKILTGRKEAFDSLRQYGGISGFPNPEESVHDAFIAGHASNSISVALGMARARTLNKEDYNVIALLGDGALTGGLAYEGLSDAGDSNEPIIVILNDNGMSIASNVGGIAHYLSKQRMKPGYISFKKFYRRIMKKIPGGKSIYRFTHGVKSAVKEAVLHCSIFEDMGFQYVGPVYGHDVKQLSWVLAKAKEQDKPVLVHVITKKGKGYGPAEQNPDAFHGVSSFEPCTGKIPEAKESFSSVFGNEIVKIGAENKSVCAITAAMELGTGLSEFADRFPKRFFDVGIAEGHGVSMAAGLAAGGETPVLAVYSSFLQRGYDMLIHDVSILKQHVVFAVDRAGLVGNDGITHQGSFDVSYLCSVPNMTVFSPSNFSELREAIRYAVNEETGPVAVRYPRGGEGEYKDGALKPVKRLREGKNITIITYGISINDALKSAKLLEKAGISAEVIELCRINPIDYTEIDLSVKKTGRVLVLEECAENGCVGERLGAHFLETGIKTDKFILKNLGNGLVTHGDVSKLKKMYRLDAESVMEDILASMENRYE